MTKAPRWHHYKPTEVDPGFTVTWLSNGEPVLNFAVTPDLMVGLHLTEQELYGLLTVVAGSVEQINRNRVEEFWAATRTEEGHAP